MRYSTTGALLVAALVTGCAALPMDNGGPGRGRATAAADIRDVAGVMLATAEATQTGGGLRVRVRASAMKPGTYAVHIHPVGSCVPPSFDSAGKHWNPAGHQHGRDNPMGAHLGDLPNIVIGANGRGTIDYTIREARLTDGPTPLLDADGGAILIHVNADDYRTDPSGNSGTKIGCGAFVRL